MLITWILIISPFLSSPFLNLFILIQLFWKTLICNSFSDNVWASILFFSYKCLCTCVVRWQLTGLWHSMTSKLFWPFFSLMWIPNLVSFFQLQKLNRIRLGNWEVDVLSKKQLEYAATDAFASWQLYQVILNICLIVLLVFLILVLLLFFIKVLKTLPDAKDATAERSDELNVVPQQWGLLLSSRNRAYLSVKTELNVGILALLFTIERLLRRSFASDENVLTFYHLHRGIVTSTPLVSWRIE